MRRSEAPLWACVALAGCAISLDPPLDAGTTATPPPVVTPGCLLFQQANPMIALLGGAGLSLALPSGSVLWTFSGATLVNNSSVSSALAHVVGDSGTACFPETMLQATAAFAASPLGDGFFSSPMDVVNVGPAVWSYYQLFEYDSTAVYGIKSAGFGIAPFDSATSQFVPTANLLWGADGPAFGTSAVVSGSDVYVYGCSSDQNGNSECYLAHAAASSIDQPAAYEYAQGAGFYTSDVTQALPVLDGPSSLNVRSHGSGRWFATYVLPLDSKVTVQSAVGPAGPFSQAQTLLNCQLGPNDFCSGGNQHPELDPDASAIAVSYVAASFNTEAPGSRYWPRLAFPTLPEELP